MSPLRVTLRRTIGRARNLYLTAFSMGGFLFAAAVLFAFALDAAEGSSFAVQAVWASSVSPLLPFLAAFLGMDVWSDERKSGRIDFLLTAPVREMDLVLGKFLGVWLLCSLATVAFLLFTVAFLAFFAPAVLSDVAVSRFAPALLILLLQGALWSGAAVAASAFCRHPAVAAVLSLFVLVAIPRGGWAALLAWAPQGRTAFGEMPLDAQTVDFASGVISTGAIASYLAGTLAVLFVASRLVAAYRLVGRGAARPRLSAAFACALALAVAGLAATLAVRAGVSFDVPVSGEARFSARTRGILADARGTVSVDCLLPRSDPRFRATGQFLRALRREAGLTGGVRLDLRFVDPRWDVGAAARLVRSGAGEEGLVFSRGQRSVSLSIAEGLDERNCASAILRLTVPPQRRNVYWTLGHGEIAFDGYDSWGMSDIVRELARDGYANVALDLMKVDQIPIDCALVIVAGAKGEFSRVEIERMDAYLRQGGRLLALLGPGENAGIASLLPSWGLRAVRSPLGDEVQTLSGEDVIASVRGDHDIASPLRNQRLVLESPLVLLPSSAANGAVGADRIEFYPLADAGQSVVAAIVEKGVGTGADLAVRPTRIVAVGDSGFAMNGQLAMRANANRDFFLNCVSYLSGTDAFVSGGSDAGVLTTGLDRSTRRHFAIAFAAGPSLAVFCCLILWAKIRRRRRK